MRSDEIRRHTVSSGYQRGPNAIEVLLPDDFDRCRTWPVLYVLPVEPGIGGFYGNGLEEVRRAGIHSKHGLVCVQMAFDTTPWYCDNPCDPTVRHESYVRNVAVPLVEKEYPTPGTPDGRLLMGFSKSGWGAFTLILRNPDFFGYAASWDAPLQFEKCHWDMGRQFGDDMNLRHYCPAGLFRAQARHFHARPRLVLLGEDAFGRSPDPKYDHTVWAHETMASLGIQHFYNDDVRVKHVWGSGWVPVAVDALVSLRRSCQL